jgi:ribosomal protein S18 acetylase RimI-like enzyme
MSFDKEFISRLRVEPFDRKRHDRTAFSCGVERIDNFLKITAGNHTDHDHGKIYVACETASDTVLGFYAIAPHCVDLSALSEEARRRLPNQPKISAIYLSMVGVGTLFQGRGLGTFLMMSALKKCVEGADIMGGHFVVLDAINEDAARMYRRIGFVDLPSQTNRMLIAMRTVRKAVAVAARNNNIGPKASHSLTQQV